MSWLSKWLHSIFDKPQPPTPPPKPVPPAPPILPPGPSPDALAARALAAMNARRAAKGLSAVILDPGLCAAAMELAVPLGKGQAEPHDGFPERVRAHGWPFEQKNIRNYGFGNTSEGISFGGQTPEESVLILDSSPDPNEGHRRDFEDPAFWFVGIAIVPSSGKGFWTGGGYICVVDYGAK